MKGRSRTGEITLKYNKNYTCLQENGQLAFIKPSNDEQAKKIQK
jgi:hypothetical protein